MNELVKKNNLKLMMVLIILSMCLQNVNIISFSSFSLKFYHIFVLLLIFKIKPANGKCKLPHLFLIMFYFLIFIVTLFSALNYGISSLLFNYIFGFYILFTFINIDENFYREDYEEILRYVSWIILVIVLANGLFNYKVIISFLKSPYGHPTYNFIFAGGANLEASWVSMMGLFSGKGKKKYVYIFLTIIFSALLASRVGIIINVLVLLYFFAKEKFGFKKIVTICAVVIVSLVIMYKTNIFSYILLRFNQTGTDPGSIGRKKMWVLFLPVLKRNIFGVGIGNSIKALENYSLMNFHENNMHNLIMQMFIELGIVGGIYYLLMMAFFFYSCLKYKEFSSFSMFLTIYIIIGCLQFRGGDALFFVILAIYLILIDRKKERKKI